MRQQVPTAKSFATLGFAIRMVPAGGLLLISNTSRARLAHNGPDFGIRQSFRAGQLGQSVSSAGVTPMPITVTATVVLEREFLELRARLLQAAAHLDRLDRAEGALTNDPRMKSIERAIAVLGGQGP